MKNKREGKEAGRSLCLQALGARSTGLRRWAALQNPVENTEWCGGRRHVWLKKKMARFPRE